MHEKNALVVDEYPISFATCSHCSPGDTVFPERLREGISWAISLAKRQRFTHMPAWGSAEIGRRGSGT